MPKKNIPVNQAACLICVLTLSLSGCVHIGSGQVLALAPLMQEVSAGTGGGVWLWLFTSIAVLICTLLVWGKKRNHITSGNEPSGQGAPLDREEMALYRTTRDSLSFLIKKRIGRTKLIHIDFLRRRKKDQD